MSTEIPVPALKNTCSLYLKYSSPDPDKNNIADLLWVSAVEYSLNQFNKSDGRIQPVQIWQTCYKQDNPRSVELKAMQPSLHPLFSPFSRFLTKTSGSSGSSADPSSDSATPALQQRRFFFERFSFEQFSFDLWQTLREDFRIIFERDPAAHHWLEVLCCYPGFHALLLYRLTHWLHGRRVVFIPRFIAHLTRFFTGIEIHPGATIGKGVFIDHGMGVVIGETAIVGDYCLIYQGVTLGGTGKETGKRHPTLGNHVVIGAGAKVLGNIHIGDYARVGAGSIVLRHVPAHCTAVGVPGRNLCRPTVEDCPLEHGRVPDAEAVVMRALLDRIEALEQQLQQLNK